ncbi:DUF1775 domain-containing protein [Streptomyces sp. NPDC020412]|uniref:DUF1775 domain-containing protein n=1 Tax=Streptomyces sp. NPDC020412 TaxID=3365073 RepID=UPI003797C968
MRTSPLSRAARRTVPAAAAALVAVLALAPPAAAHAHVEASEARALATNVTVTLTSEAESRKAGLSAIQVMLPEGISPGTVSLKQAPKGWRFAQNQGGYVVGGKPLPTGTDAVHSIVVHQLPDAKRLVFKVMETYADGQVARWIEVPEGGAEPENPAPVLALKPKVPDARPVPFRPTAPSTPPPSAPARSTASADPAPDTDAPAPAASDSIASAPAAATPTPKADGGDGDDGGGNGALVAVTAGALVVAAGAGGGVWYLRRRRAAAS